MLNHDDPGMSEKHRTQNRFIRYGVGICIAMFGTLIAVYLVPEALAAYHWTVSVGAFCLAELYSVYLLFAFTDEFDQDRLRFFLKSYLMSLAVVFVAPYGIPSVFLQVEPIARGLAILPLLAIFVSIASTHVWTSVNSYLVVNRK